MTDDERDELNLATIGVLALCIHAFGIVGVVVCVLLYYGARERGRRREQRERDQSSAQDSS